MALTPLLYTYRRCPYAMRARMALLQAGIAFEAHEITLRDKPAAMLALSPKGTVPVLLLCDGTVLEQSLDIMRWAFAQTGDPDLWWARSQTAENRELQALCDGPFKHHLDRYKYPQRFDDTAVPGQHRTEAVRQLLEPLNSVLQVQDQLGGATGCAADLGIFPFVRQFAAVDPHWFEALPLAPLKRWLALWLAHPLFERAMRKQSGSGVVQ